MPDFSHPASPPQARASLPRAVIILSWVSLFADISGEMIYPLLPLFLVGVLGASGGTLGEIEGAASLVIALATAWSGWHSDQLRRRLPYVKVGYGLPIVGKALLALASGPGLVLAGRLIDRLGKGLRSSPRDAMIANAVDPAARGRAFGFHRALDTAGALAGVLLSAGLLWLWTGSPAQSPQTDIGADAGPAMRLIFGVAAVLGAVSLGLTFLVPEALPGQITVKHAPAKISALPRKYWLGLVPLLLFAFANSSDAFLLLRTRQAGYSSWSVVLAYGLFNLVYALASYPAGRISDRLGRTRVLLLGWLVYAVVYAGFAVGSGFGFWFLFALYGAFMALTDGVAKAFIADLSPPEQRGTALGLYSLVSGVALLLSSIVAGWLWDRYGPAAAFWAGAGTAALASGLLFAWRRRLSGSINNLARET